MAMKKSFIIHALLFCTLLAFGQNRKLPPNGTKYPISKFRFDYPLQTGKLDIVRNDSSGQIILSTENSELKFDTKDVFDSVVIPLFQRGILTSDILLKAINEEAKFIDYKGDTLDYTNHITTKTVTLKSIQQEAIPKYIKNKKGGTFFKVFITFTEHSSPPMYAFILYLRAGIDPKQINFAEYLKNVNAKYIQFSGFEF